LKQLPIGVKFFGAFALILAFMVLGAMQAWRDIHSVRTSVADLREGPLKVVEAGVSAQRDFLQLRLLLAEHKQPDPPHYKARIEAIRHNLETILHLSTEPTVKTHAERATRLLVEWDLLVRNGGLDRDHRLDTLTDLIQSDIDNNVAGARASADRSAEEVERVVTGAAAMIAVIAACTIILGLVAGWLVNDVLRHLADAVGHARRIAAGDLDKVIEVKRHDEPGQLLAALESMRRDLKEQQDALERLATTDSLTGLPNRRRLEEASRLFMARVKRHGEALSVIMIDVDKFKSVNDTHGHQVGDEILKQVAWVLKHTIRESDFVGRWGGEEFMVLCPATKIAEARLVAEKLREAVAAHEFPVVGQKTASFGVAELIASEPLEHAVERADSALYRAKENGRNRVEVTLAG